MGRKVPGVMFGSSGERESCGRQPEAKTGNKSVGGELPERVSLGLLVPSVITSISHSQSFQSCFHLS